MDVVRSLKDRQAGIIVIPLLVKSELKAAHAWRIKKGLSEAANGRAARAGDEDGE